MAVALACASLEPLSPGRLTLEPAAGGAAAVVGVVLFSSVAPDNFAVFDRAFLTLFYVTSGDPWPDALHKVLRRGRVVSPIGACRSPRRKASCDSRVARQSIIAGKGCEKVCSPASWRSSP